MVRIRGLMHEKTSALCCTREIYDRVKESWNNIVPVNSPVYVLLWTNSLCNKPFASRVDMLAKRKLNEDTAHAFVCIEFLHDLDYVICRGFGGNVDMTKLDPDLLCSLGFHANIGRRVWTFASLNDRELRLETRKLGLGRLDALSYILAYGSAKL